MKLKYLYSLLIILGGFEIIALFAAFGSAWAGWTTGFILSMVLIAIVTILMIILVIIIRRQRRVNKKWSKVVAVARSHEEISLEDLSKQSGVPVDEVDDLVYDAISSGHLKGVVKENRYVRSAPAQPVSARPSETTREKVVTERVLVICPYCGAKTEQGLSKCQNCEAQL